MASAIVVGACFSSLEGLEEEIAKFEKEACVTFWKRDAKTIQSMLNKHSSLDKARKELKYYSIQYACVSGGRNHQKRCTDNSRQSKTFRQSCPAFIKVLLSSDKQSLQVKAVNVEHNHPTTQTTFNSLPKVRRLDDGHKNNVKKLMDLQVNKKLLQQSIVKETGKHVTLKDISNIAAKGSRVDNFDEILDILQNDHKCCVSVLKDDAQTLQGLFIQDNEMKNMFASYPEIIFFDGTYKLTNINFTCYVFLVEDGNGSSEIVGVGLLAHENKDSVHWLISSFQQNNSEWSNTQVVVTDKDFTERGVFTDLFPEVKLEICLFHTLKTFRREITPEKMSITRELCDSIKELLTKLAYSQTEESYASVYEEFKKVAPASVVKYFDTNWHNIREEWTYMSCANGNFLNMTNNRLESLNGKLKSVIQKFSSLKYFVENLFCIILSLRQERSHQTSNAFLKVPSVKFLVGSAEENYFQLLNPYPFHALLTQLNISRDDKVTAVKDNGFFFDCQGNSFVVTPDTCKCIWFRAMKLPCRHIFSVRRKLDMGLYDETLCNNRWLRTHLVSVHRTFNLISEGAATYTVAESVNTVPKTVSGRFSFINSYMQRLASTAADSTGDEFLEKVGVVKQLLDLWEQGKKVVISSVEPHEANLIVEDSRLPHLNLQTAAKDHNYGQSVSTLKDPGTQSTDVFVRNKSQIKLPAPVKRKGRPAGSLTTVIGLKKRKTLMPIPFSRKPLIQRQGLLLRCFVEETVALDALHKGVLIEEEEVETDIAKVPSSCMESCVNLEDIKSLFTPDGWLSVQNVCTIKARLPTYECGTCHKDCQNGCTVLCDSCLLWHHNSCVGLVEPPKQKYWFCRNCG